MSTEMHVKEGLIPGPDESEQTFQTRTHYCLHIDHELENIPFSDQCRASNQLIEEAYPITKRLFGITPSWIPVYFSNHQLSPWHGGCAWIVQLKEDSPLSALFQLRKKFQSNKKVGGYSRQETLAHELAHVGRMAFEEPKFEEILAYQTSPSWFRRWFGPMLQSSRESLLFVIFLLSIFLLDLFCLLTGHPILWWPKLLPLACVTLALTRLSLRHVQFRRCLKKLRKLTDNPQPLIYRLTDKEIIQLGKLTTAQIKTYATKQQCPRWCQIKSHFIPPQ